jgi:hypothetical protein
MVAFEWLLSWAMQKLKNQEGWWENIAASLFWGCIYSMNFHWFSNMSLRPTEVRAKDMERCVVHICWTVHQHNMLPGLLTYFCSFLGRK